MVRWWNPPTNERHCAAGERQAKSLVSESAEGGPHRAAFFITWRDRKDVHPKLTFCVHFYGH